MVQHYIDIIIRVLQKGNPLQAIRKYRSNLQSLTRTQRFFHMEMLGVMFAGMALQRMFMSLLQPALQLTGVFEYWSSVLAILFLPIVLALLPTILELGQFLMDLSPEIKKIIGIVAILGVALGGLMMFMGQAGLALGSLAIVAAGLGVGLLPLIAVIGAIAAAVGVLLLAWTENWFGIQDVVKSAQPVIDKAIQLVMNVLNELKEIFKLVMEIIIAALAEFGIDWTDLWNTIAWIMQNAWGVMKPIFDAIKTALTWIKDNIGPIMREVRAAGLGGMLPGGPAPYFALEVNRLRKERERGFEASREAASARAAANIIENVEFSPTVNITATSSADIDIMKSQLDREWWDDVDSMLRSR